MNGVVFLQTWVNRPDFLAPFVVKIVRSLSHNIMLNIRILNIDGKGHLIWEGSTEKIVKVVGVVKVCGERVLEGDRKF